MREEWSLRMVHRVTAMIALALRALISARSSMWPSMVSFTEQPPCLGLGVEAQTGDRDPSRSFRPARRLW